MVIMSLCCYLNMAISGMLSDSVDEMVTTILEKIDKNYFNSEIFDFSINGIKCAKHVVLDYMGNFDLSNKSEFISNVYGLNLNNAKFKIGNDITLYNHLFLFYKNSPDFTDDVLNSYLDKFSEISKNPRYFMFLSDGVNFNKSLGDITLFSDTEISALESSSYINSDLSHFNKSFLEYFHPSTQNTKSKLELLKIYLDTLNVPRSVKLKKSQRREISIAQDDSLIPIPYFKIMG